MIDILLEFLKEDKLTIKLNVKILSCISYAVQIGEISRKMLTLLESNINSFD